MKIASKIVLASLLAASMFSGVAVAQDVDNDRTVVRTDDDGPDMGWLGLIGLIGLAGLKRRDPAVYDATRDARPNTSVR